MRSRDEYLTWIGVGFLLSQYVLHVKSCYNGGGYIQIYVKLLDTVKEALLVPFVTLQNISTTTVKSLI